MRETVLVAAALASFGLLSACGNSSSGQEYRVALQQLGGVVRPAETAPPAAIARASYQVVPGPLIFVNLPEFSVAAPMVPFGENRGFRTWSTAEKQTLTTRGAIMSATRGLGDDLMRASVEGIAQAVAAGSGDGVARTTWHLDGNEQFIIRRFDCTVRTVGRDEITLGSGERIAGVQVREDCTSDDTRFRNTYWKDENGTVRRSRQWVSPIVGYAEIEVLRP
jgi:hypothetical protein